MKTKVKNNGKFPKFLLNCIVIFFLIGFGIILLSLLFNNLVLFEQFNIFSILLSLIIYSCYIFIVYKILDRMKFLRRKYFWIFMLFYILLQIIAIIFLTVEPGWDFKIVFEFAAGSNPDIMYFYQFQNNALFAYILKAFLYPFKLIGVQNLLIPAMVFNAFLYDVGLVFLYKIIVNFFNPKIKKLSVYLLFSTLPYLLHVPIVYTDSSVFALSSIITYYSFYFILHKFPASTFTFLDWKDIVRAIALGLSTGLIIYIKTPIFILFIALTIILCFKKYCLRTFKYLSFSVLAIA